ALGWWIASLFTDAILWKGIGTAGGFVLSFLVLRIFSGILQKRRCDVVITGILSTNPDHQNETDETGS
ncbi:MAG: hypothetical protein J5722_06385, partial [Oscillospiraceae bacterium]|nr:hypothetical protein [Oscillospiraceae bacterium]